MLTVNQLPFVVNKLYPLNFVLYTCRQAPFVLAVRQASPSYPAYGGQVCLDFVLSTFFFEAGVKFRNETIEAFQLNSSLIIQHS